MQSRFWKSESYLYTGTSDTLGGVTATTLKRTNAGWEPDQWKGMVLLANVLYPTINYRISGNTADTITINSAGGNTINTTYALSGSTFAIVWGKLIKENINYRSVKFFRQSGNKSFADDDGTIDGICQVCHTRTTSFNNSGTLEGAGHPALQAGRKCSLCHNHNSGFKQNCRDCHGTPPVWNTPGGPSGLANTDGGTGATTAGAHTKHAITQGYACETCHANGMPYTAFTTTIYDKKLQLGFSIGTFQGGNFDGRSSLANGYTYSSSNAGTNITQSGSLICSSIYCHSDGSAVATGIVPSSSSPNWATGTTTCTSCHLFPPVGLAKPNSHTAHDYPCQNCHYDTTTTGNSITNAAKHANGVFDLAPGPGRSFSYSFSYPKGTCSTVSCHTNTGTTWGASACLDCHAIAQGARAAVTAHFNGNSHHVQGTAITGAICYQCHWEANADGSINADYHGGSAAPGSVVNLVVYSAGSRPATYSLGTTALQYMANGTRTEVAKVTSHCLGCHSDGNNGTRPFGDGKTPNHYAWDGTSIAARYSQLGTTLWGKYSSTPNAAKKALTKTYSAHGNGAGNQRGWDMSTGVDDVIADTSGAVNVQCFDCHNSHGSTVSGRTTRYSPATVNGGILKDTTAGIGGYGATYKPVSGGTTTNKNVRNPGASICLDCHLTANAGPATPWGYTSTFGASQAIIGYWDSPYLAPGSAGAQLRYPYKGLRQNAGGHFGASSPLSSAPMSTIDGLCTPCHDPHGVSPTLGSNQQYGVPMLKGTWLTSPFKEDAAPANNAPGTIRIEGVKIHIDQNTFGTGLNNAAGFGISQTDTQFAGLCLSCHPKSSLTNGTTHTWKSKDRVHESVKGWKTASATMQHSYTCSKCHSPHNGSVLPRLMVTNCMDGKHKGRKGFDVRAVLSGSGNGYDNGGSADCYGQASILGNCGSTGSGGGSGSGRVPGSWSGSAYGDYSISCHENQTGSGTDQGWNVKTNWAVYPSIAITSGPAVNLSSTGTNVQANVTWSTNLLTTSRVDYGPTAAYGMSATVSTPTADNAVILQNLANHSTYHYRVTSVAPADSQQISSADGVFTPSIPPSVPVIIANSAYQCASACGVLLQWNPSTDPDNGPLRYRVQLGTDYWFNTVLYDSGWIPGTSITTSDLSVNTGYYWRVQARDDNHPAAASAWSPHQYITVTDDRPTIYSWTISSGTPTSSGSDIMATISWSTNKAATSWVDYGTTSLVYTRTAGTDSPLLLTHNVILHSLSNHATNYYRVRSAGGALGVEASSIEHSFILSLPPSVPVIIPEPNSACAGNCTVPLGWNASVDPDSGPIEYHVQVSSVPSFGTLVYDSIWLNSTNVATSDLPTNSTYYWRVQARDAAAPSAVSAWSPAGSFTLESLPVITAGPSAGSFMISTAVNGTAAITWTTDIASTSCVDYGTTTSYGTSVCPAGSVKDHLVSIGSLTNHTTYHYRVRSTGSFSNETVSGDNAFFFSVPPTVPVVADEPNMYCAGTCSVTLQWAPSTDPDGGPVAYSVQISTDPSFGSVNTSMSDITENSATVSLATGTTWNWRVRSFDTNYPTTFSGWSTADAFKLLSAEPPVAPTVIPHGNFDSGCADTLVTVQWSPVTSPDGHGVQYRVTSDSGYPADSGWLPAGQTNWQFTNYAAYGVTWRVMARDSVHTDAESSWSSSDYFYDLGSGCYSGSCPLVFAWDGASFSYITDLQGPVIGLPASNIRKDPSRYQPVYAVLDGLIPSQGEYRIKLRESLAENTYIDAATLLVADIPSGHEIATSSAENTYNYNYVDPFTLYTLKDPVLPLSAADKNGDSVLTAVLAVDNMPVSVSDNALDFYTFDFGAIGRPDHAKLLIDGWSVYGVKKFRSDVTIQPYIELVDKDGSWVKVRSMGTPAGDLKMMVVDLSGLFLSSDHRVRVHMGLRRGSRWVIDRIRLDDSEPVPVALLEVGAASADLKQAGVAVQSMGSVYSRIIASDQNLPIDPSSLGYGKFTRYGETAPLLSYRDDKYVIMRHGDQLELLFPSLDQPTPGNKRSFILKTDLYYKTFEVSRNTDPMPFHGMTAYPYSAPETYPADAEHQQYLLDYNTRQY